MNPQTGNVEETVTLEVIPNGNLNSSNYDIEWYLNGTLVGTGYQYEADEVGTYDVIPIKLTPENAPDCSYEPTTVEVTLSSVAEAEVVVTDTFENFAVATVTITNGFGTYEFSLDNEIFQTSNVFENLTSGEHTIILNDIYGNCGDRTLTFTVIKYPKFFTPNGDGYNDRWNIFDLKEDSFAIISIFDRYGKLIKQITPSGLGWDGTYNGSLLPSSDYWFVVNYNYNGEERTFKAHFTMKR
ncbi:MAG: T9SS type B sorting domain-containing protein [Flavobacterium sp.]|nr:T9SS type B sorting domain-containing protein [Flavobacterium sp.]